MLLGGGGRFDYYVDPVNGSDSNSGKNSASAKATFGSITQRSGLRVGFMAQTGVVALREALTISKSGMLLGRVGTGEFRVYGSTKHTSGWTLVTGTEYKKVIGYTAVNAFSIAGDGTVTKLILGTAGSLTSGQFGVTGSGGTTEVRINIGSDPNSATIEIPNTGSANGITVNASNVTLQDLSIWFAGGEGVISTAVANVLGNRLDIRYNGEDGWGVHASGGVAATNIVVQNSIIKRNGQTRTLTGTAGDGVSYHETCTGKVLSCDIEDNEKSGITNQYRTVVDVIGCTLRNNDQEYFIIDDGLGQGGGGTNRLLYSTLDVPGSTDTASFACQIMNNTNGSPTVVIENNVFYGESIVANRSAIRINDGAVTAKNNIITGFARGIDWRSTDSGSLANDYNCMFGNTANYFNNGTAGVVAGAHDITSDPKLNNPASFDFTLQSGSPCIAAGVDVGLTLDKAGTAVPLGAAPCIGAYERV